MSFNARYKRALNEVRAGSPQPGEIMETAAVFAGDAPREPRRFRLVTAGGGLAALAVGAIGIFALIPTQANAFERMKQALKSVPASHTVYYSPSGEIVQEIWREGVKRRYRANFEAADGPGQRSLTDRGFDGKAVWILWRDGSASISDADAPDGFGLQSTSVEEMLQAYEKSGSKPEVSQKPGPNGGTILTISFAGRKQIYYCRATDGLPTRIENVSPTDSKKQTLAAEISYPIDLDDSVFEFKPQPHHRIADHRIAKRMILDGAAGKSGQTQTLHGVKVTLLGAFEQADGQLFVLWTGGALPHVDGRGSVVGQVDNFVSYPYRMLTEPVAVSPANAEIDSSIQDGVLLGGAPSKPYTVEPFSTVGTTAIHAMSVKVKPSQSGQELEIHLPLFKKGPERVLRWNDKGAWFKSPGIPVGVATFKVRTLPVDFFYGFMADIIDGTRSWAGVPQNPLTPAKPNR